MQTVLTSTHTAITRYTLALDSYDCGEEFSLHHWMEVRRLVDDDAGLLETPDIEALEEIVQDTTISEVEPATADEDFASHVI